MTEAVPQHDVALALANEIRIERAAMRRKIHAMDRDEGCLKLAEYVANPPRPLETIKVSVLVDWIWGVGRLRSRKFLRSVSIHRPEAELAELTASERKRLASALREGI